MTPGGIVIHCSASGYGSAELIDDWHRDRGFQRADPRSGLRHIGYHYVVGNGRESSSDSYRAEADGVIWRGRREGEIGAHARGCNSWIGICLIGKNGIFTPAQLAALWALSASFVVRYGLRDLEVIGHCETKHERSARSPKTCTELDMDEQRAAIFRVASGLKTELMC